MAALSRDQETALSRISQWLKGSEKFFVLDGPAGSGKTELAKHVARQTEAMFCSFTGKAANVLRSRGLDATTLHRTLYKPKEKGRGRLADMMSALIQLETTYIHAPTEQNRRAVVRLKADIARERRRTASPRWEVPHDAPVKSAKLVVVDEYSMLNAQMINDLNTHASKVLFLGDPNQLPPVSGECPLKGRANFALTTVHRTALDNPILWAVTQMRETGRIPTETRSNELGTWEVLTRDKTSWEEHFAEADITITRYNATRTKFNKKFRAKLGQTGLVDLEDRVIFLRNDHDLEVYNGTTGSVSHFIDGDGMVDLVVDMDDGRQIALDAWSGVLHGRDPREADRRVQIVDHAYAITGHKSQGSEYDRVVVWDESDGHDRSWNYTAATRAKKRCTFVLQ